MKCHHNDKMDYGTKRRPTFVQNFQELIVEQNLIKDITRYSRDIGLDEVTTEDVTELFEARGLSLSNEDLEE